MTEKKGVARLCRAIENQATAGEACFSLPIGEATAIYDECEDELARVSWAKGVPAPVDADGNVVPLTTKVMYGEDGREREGSLYRSFIWSRERGRWYFGVAEGSREVDELHLSRPDSWEKLEEDIERYKEWSTSCAYYDRLSSSGCVGCPAKGTEYCGSQVARDVMRRAKALAERDAKGADRD